MFRAGMACKDPLTQDWHEWGGILAARLGHDKCVPHSPEGPICPIIEVANVYTDAFPDEGK